MSHYSSDESTEGHRRGRRHNGSYRSPSEDEHYRRHFDHAEPTREDKQHDKHEKYDKLGRMAIIVGLVGGIFHLWHSEKSAERKKQERRRKRRDFERAKARRRKEEERSERQQARHDDHSPDPDMRRIGYGSSVARSRSSSREPRTIEPPPPRSGRNSRRQSPVEGGYESDRRASSRMR